jgi:hypothetical protein
VTARSGGFKQLRELFVRGAGGAMGAIGFGGGAAGVAAGGFAHGAGAFTFFAAVRGAARDEKRGGADDEGGEFDEFHNLIFGLVAVGSGGL